MSGPNQHVCPHHTTLANGRLFGPRHPCFTVYDPEPTATEEDDQ